MSNYIETDTREYRIYNDLNKLVDTTLSNPAVGPKLKRLLSTTGVSDQDLKIEVLSYTLGIKGKDYFNASYQNLVSRMTLHFHNQVEGTYHHERHRLVESFLEEAKPKKFMDIGYGVPAPYIFSYLKKHPDATVTLLDQDKNAETFARMLIRKEERELEPRIKYRTYNMDKEKYPGNADTYIYLDSIEHTRRPTEYIKSVVEKSKSGSHFIFSLPISSMESFDRFHYVEWLSEPNAKRWVENAGLKVIREGTVYPNPSVDYFAELIKGGFHNYLVLAKKV